MPKYYKKPKGVEGYQYLLENDWKNAEPWVKAAIAMGQIVIDDEGVKLVYVWMATPIEVHHTNWFVLDNDTGGLSVMTNEQFLETYEKDKTAGTGEEGEADVGSASPV